MKKSNLPWYALSRLRRWNANHRRTLHRFSTFAGNDIATLPDFPAEIRAPPPPLGTLAGVSGYQLQFGSTSILTPGDEPDALVAMNPAALKANIADLPEGGMLVINVDSFKKMNLKKAGYESNPLEDEEFRKKYQLIELDLTSFDQGSFV